MEGLMNMNTYDPQKAARVWQRVQSQQPEPQIQPRERNIPALIMGEMTAATTYLHLARQMSAQQASVLQRLAREEQAHAACLKGIYNLITGQPAVIQTPQVPKESAELTLRRCYGMEMRSLAEYESHRDDPEYGHVFAKLAEQEREHCRAVLELIGGLRAANKGSR